MLRLLLLFALASPPTVLDYRLLYNHREGRLVKKGQDYSRHQILCFRGSSQLPLSVLD